MFYSGNTPTHTSKKLIIRWSTTGSEANSWALARRVGEYPSEELLVVYITIADLDRPDPGKVRKTCSPKPKGTLLRRDMAILPACEAMERKGNTYKK
ncbi:hypothetical protein TNCV_3553901 [Trichonephila clavipes]|nr:hypothetical protein TNCV_3553901 [Trichonephila clavipes]